MNRTGSVLATDTQLIYLVVGLPVLIIVFGGFLATTTLIENKKTRDYEGIQREMTAARLLYSTKCFAFHNSQRSYPGIIDKAKLTDDRLDKCLKVTNQKPEPIKLFLYEGNTLIGDATSSSWEQTPTQIVERQRYPVSIDKSKIGVLEVYHK